MSGFTTLTTLTVAKEVSSGPSVYSTAQTAITRASDGSMSFTDAGGNTVVVQSSNIDFAKLFAVASGLV